MAEHNILGQQGEEIAQKHLQSKGYRIVAKNWRFRKDEIDIIALHKNMLIIVEVKTRSTTFFGEPETFVTKGKQRNLIRATNAYIEETDSDFEVRFDIVSVLLNGSKHKVEHLEDAFYP